MRFRDIMKDIARTKSNMADQVRAEYGGKGREVGGIWEAVFLAMPAYAFVLDNVAMHVVSLLKQTRLAGPRDSSCIGGDIATTSSIVTRSSISNNFPFSLHPPPFLS